MWFHEGTVAELYWVTFHSSRFYLNEKLSKCFDLQFVDCLKITVCLILSLAGDTNKHFDRKCHQHPRCHSRHSHLCRQNRRSRRNRRSHLGHRDRSPHYPFRNPNSWGICFLCSCVSQSFQQVRRRGRQQEQNKNKSQTLATMNVGM